MMPLTSTPPYLFVFYSSGYLHNRDLHSFPTRRSSDLNATYPFLDFDKQMKTAVLCGRESVQIRPTTNKRRDLKDRKSTRLNSSHVAISYAVFCLKKKKNVHIARQLHQHDVGSTDTPQL